MRSAAANVPRFRRLVAPTRGNSPASLHTSPLQSLVTATPCGTTLTHQGQRSMVAVGSADAPEIIWDRRWIGRLRRQRAPRPPVKNAPGALTTSRVSSGRAGSAARARRSSSASGVTAGFARMIERAAAGVGLELRPIPDLALHSAGLFIRSNQSAAAGLQWAARVQIGQSFCNQRLHSRRHHPSLCEPA
jgi:hypothetical protein